MRVQTYGPRSVEFHFDSKPSEAVRNTLKAHGFRWSSGGGYWFNTRCAAWRDVQAAVAMAEYRDAHPGFDGACTDCGANGRRFSWWDGGSRNSLICCDPCAKRRHLIRPTVEEQQAAHRAAVAADDFDLANNRSL